MPFPIDFLRAPSCDQLTCIKMVGCIDWKELTRLLNILAFCEYLESSKSVITPLITALASTCPCSISTFLGAVIFKLPSSSDYAVACERNDVVESALLVSRNYFGPLRMSRAVQGRFQRTTEVMLNSHPSVTTYT
jgi:hypothetical protein